MRRAITKAGAAVAPISIAAGAIAASTTARRQNGSVGDAVAIDSLDTAKSFALYGAAQYGISKGLVRAGMTAAKASGVASLAISAYGAAEGAWDARKNGGAAMLKGAVKGAWEYSLPGMLYEGVKDLRAATKDLKTVGAEERERFARENARWQKPGKPQSGDTYERTRRDPRSGKMITEQVRKPKRDRKNPDWDIAIDPKTNKDED